MLPSYIPTKVAQKILFVGESVEMFEKIDVNGRQQRHQGGYNTQYGHQGGHRTQSHHLGFLLSSPSGLISNLSDFTMSATFRLFASLQSMLQYSNNLPATFHIPQGYGAVTPHFTNE